MTPGWRTAIPLTVLVAIHLATLFGGFLAPNSALEQNRELAWAPPTKLRFVDAEGRFHFRPFVYVLIPTQNNSSLYKEDEDRPFPVHLLMRGESYNLGGIIPSNLHFIGVTAPAKLYFFGTDGVGRDVFARTLVGGSVTLGAGLLATGLSLSIGTLLGGLAGYSGGKTDTALMRFTDMFLALPWLYLLLALRAFLPLTLPPLHAFLFLVVVIGVAGWPVPARLVRGAVLKIRQSAFVSAAVGAGASPTHLMRRHILPETIPMLATHAALLIPSYVLAEVTLSFFGLGLPDPQPTWGGLLQDLRKYHILAGYPWMLAPAVPLLLTFFSYHALGRLQKH